MSSSLSLKSMPMILSACLRSSFFTRVAAGEADGDACGVGVGVCASVISGALVATIAAAPAAGRTFTKARRVIDLRFDVFMIMSNCDSSADYADYTDEKEQPRKSTRGIWDDARSTAAVPFCAFSAFSWPIPAQQIQSAPLT